MRVFLSESAFMGLILSSIEVYKKECLGLLLGYKLEDRFIVEYSLPYQSAKRMRNGVSPNHFRHNRIENVLPRFDKLEIVGDFHSHPQYGSLKGVPKPSRLDINDMESGKLYMIIAINDNRRSVRWGENLDGTISGTLNNFHFKISAYHFEGRKIRRSVIKCPFCLAIEN
ncbi:MAG TPA: Mov34/MPN/PAD-1 family protein [Thermodesulfobacteriota bacterium]|jgi:proteasome lid subunit RPN8/RPN11|nr:Mov34/MPN/PAD-1 family protein [Thermodesulfobacteriota bacterium]